MIIEKLEKLKDEKYKEFSEKLIPGTKIIGVRLPILRKLAKKIKLEELTDNTFEEIMLQGMVIGNIKDFNKFREECTKFLPKIDNWSICDSFVSSLHIANVYKEETFIFLEDLLSTKKEFTKRFILVMYLRYFICDDYIDKVIDNLKKFKLDSYYTEMAYAWCLAEIYLKYNDKFFDFLKEEHKNLPDFTLRKTISKIKESKKSTKSDIIELTRFMEVIL